MSPDPADNQLLLEQAADSNLCLGVVVPTSRPVFLFIYFAVGVGAHQPQQGAQVQCDCQDLSL